MNIQPATRIVLFVGHLVPVKGPDILLQAWARLQRSLAPARPHAHTPTLLLLGDGPMRGRLERQARDLGVADTVQFLGSRPHEEVALWMNVADCLCLPSRAEGMPNVVLEALGAGLPIVATDVGAVLELLEGEPEARVVRTEVSGQKPVVSSERLESAIAAALAEVLGKSVGREAMAERHATVRTWREQAEEIVRLIGGQGEASRAPLRARGQA